MRYKIWARVLNRCTDSAGNDYREGQEIQIDLSDTFHFYHVVKDGKPAGLIASANIKVLGAENNVD